MTTPPTPGRSTSIPNAPEGPLDLQEVIRYGAERGIGVILYVNHKALEKQLDELLPLYQKWGVKGIKFGFVNVGTQKWTSWMHEAIRKAAAHHLMVDVHDEYRPTGWSRTYPNFMTQEGIRGDEERQPNTMSLTTLFTRMLAGAADNTICYYDQRVDVQATHAYQLAKAVCFYSPWQFLYWYDRPFVSREVTRPARRCPQRDRRRAGAGILRPLPDGLGRHEGPARQHRPVRGDRPPQRRQLVHRRA